MTQLFEIKDDTQGPWDLDLGRLMLDEGIELRRLTGYGPRQWIDQLGEDDPLAVRFAFYLARKRAGDDIPFGEINVNLFELSITMKGEDDQDQVTPDAGVTEDNADVVPTGPATDETRPDQT